MVNQRSGSACNQGYSWGFDRGGVWVDHGCRADFAIDSYQYRGPAPGSVGTITCSSDDGNRHYCNLDSRGRVQLQRQRSGSPCTEGYSWGSDGRAIWVDHGCRADFSVESGRGGWNRDDDDCDVRAYNRYRQSYYGPDYYQPNYYQPSYAPYGNGYGYAPQYYGAPGNGLAGLIYKRDSAQLQYQMAMQRGDRVAAKHLRNAVIDLNKRIAHAELKSGVRSYGYSALGLDAYNSPYANSYGYNQNQYGYGYGNSGYGYGNGGLDSLIAPLLSGYIR